MTLIKTRPVNEYDDIPARAVTVKHAKGSLATPAYAVSVAEIDQKFVKSEDLRGVVEVFVRFRQELLEGVHNDLELRKKLEYRVNSYMNRVPGDQLVVAVPLIEGERGYALTMNKASFYGIHIAELISHPRVDIVCTPTLHGIAEEHFDVLIEKFLETTTSFDVGVALSIPYYVSRAMWHRLIEIYLKAVNKNNRALLNFLCVDYNGSNPISKYTLHNYVLRYVRTLQEEIGEPVVVYGVNVKYSRVARKYDELPARDLASYFAQVDVFGKNHRRLPIPGDVAERLKSEESLKKQKLLNRRRYTYISLDKTIEDPNLAVPEANRVRELVEEKRDRSLIERVVNRINMKSILAEIDVLRPLFSGRGWQHFENPIQYLNSKEVVKIDNVLTRRLKEFSKVLTSKRLDEYLG